jgi:hypothetical integral membrane protein (TIGR02206 family)
LTPIWWQTIIWSAGLIAGIIFIGKKLDSIKREMLIKTVAAFLIARAILVHPYVHYTVGWDIYNSLPLHLCGLSAILSGIVLLVRKQLLFELVYFWGIPGAFHSLVTPEFTQGWQGLLFVEYYISHGGIILSALMCTILLGFKPRPGSWWKIFLGSQILLPIIGIFNWLIDANYMYICAPPIVENPFIIGDFPEHLIGLEIAGLLHFAVVYLPYGLKYRKENISRLIST